MHSGPRQGQMRCSGNDLDMKIAFGTGRLGQSDLLNVRALNKPTDAFRLRPEKSCTYFKLHLPHGQETESSPSQKYS
jgi:hypothetical protein